MERRCSETKKGATVAPFLAGEAAYRFLPPFFFPPVFFAIAFIPPFRVGSDREGLSPFGVAPLPSGTSADCSSVPVAWLLAFHLAAADSHLKKNLGVSVVDTPSRQASA
jgi:hypothetical protein